ncbi:hypothetical protein B5M42_010735 [Paenibacillus athensensis]|uniref:hypothetical protein n=1 Tax=Paenibacillus athensensis TaxID=1967502 RepID=UPI00107033C4|nr:hypothetical protein [Paenibacillus athensensis]MCD1259311.1 hypothetical protein [Paenibacillus athensensis]
MKRRMRTILGYLTLLIFLQIPLFSAANTPDCGSTTGTQYNCQNAFIKNYGTSGTGITFASTSFYTPSYPVTYAQSTSLATIMIGGSSKYAYVQDGWRYYNDTAFSKSGMHYFAEYSYSSSSWFEIIGTYGPAANSSHIYKINKDSSGNFVTTIDSTTVGSYSGFLASGIQVGEEVSSSTGNAFKAAFGGGASSKASFSQLTVVYNGTTDNHPSLTSVTDTNTMQDSYYYYTQNGPMYLWDSRY